jgi:hypothetical protein
MLPIMLNRHKHQEVKCSLHSFSKKDYKKIPFQVLVTHTSSKSQEGRARIGPHFSTKGDVNKGEMTCANRGFYLQT